MGEFAKEKFRSTGTKTLLVAADLGGSDAIQDVISVGVVIPIVPSQDHDPWLWIDDVTNGSSLTPDIGAVAFDSGTSIGEMLLNWITKSDKQVGQQKTMKFSVGGGKGRSLVVGANNESHYGLVQNFLLDQIWRSTWLIHKGLDVIWTFGLDRSEKQDSTPVVGPKLAGHALTSSIPKWFRYTFRLVSIPTTAGQAPRHVLHLQEQPDLGGVGMSFANARYPLGADTPLPATIEPASVVEALRLIEAGQLEADTKLRKELGL